MQIRNKSGFSLIEILVTMGIMSGMTLGVMQLIAVSRAQFKLAELKESMTESHVNIETVLMTRDACVNTFSVLGNLAGATVGAPINVPAIRDGAAAPGNILHQPGVFNRDHFPRQPIPPVPVATATALAQYRLLTVRVIEGNNTNAPQVVGGQTVPPNSFIVSFQFRLTNNVGRSVGAATGNRDYFRRSVFQAEFNGAGSVVSCNSEKSSEYDAIFINSNMPPIVPPAGVEVKIGNLDIVGRLHVTPNPPGDGNLSGYIFAREFLLTSDASKKTQIKTVANPVNTFLKLNGVEFDWRGSGQHDWGVVAQDVEEVLPFLVKTDSKSHLKSVNYNGLVAYSIESIKQIEKDHQKIDRKFQSLESLTKKIEHRMRLRSKLKESKYD